VYYIRYANDFLIGIQGSKKICEKIRDEVKFFLEKQLVLKLNIDKIKITHSILNQILFLGYHVRCTSTESSKVGFNFKKPFVKKTTQIILEAPIKKVVTKLKKKGFLNSKNMPTSNGRYKNIDL